MPATVQFAAELAQVMEAMPYGLYIVGSRNPDGGLNGMMADWVMQMSFTPRLVGVAFENDAHTLDNIREQGWFTVNFLPANEDGRHLAAKFAQPYNGGKVMGRTDGEKEVVHHKVDGIPHAISPHGAPILDGGIAWLELRAEQFVPVGDHTLVVGEVIAGRLVTRDEVLTSTYTGWTYSG